MKLQHVMQEVARDPWAILPGKLEAILDVVRVHAAGGQLPKYEAAAARGPQVAGGVAVVPVYGIISQRMNMMTAMSGGTSTDLLAAQLDQLVADPAVKGIVLDVDSPGGSVYGVQELGDRILAARGVKRIVAVANAQAASAAYWLASAAEEIFVTPSGEVGSVGVIAAHVDSSLAQEAEGMKWTLVTAGKYKAEMSDLVPLASEARDYMQSRVDDYYRAFVGAVAKGRGTTPDAVRAGFGEGRMVGAKDAVRLGMADRVGTLADAIVRAGQRPRTTDDRTRALRQLEHEAK